MEIQRAIYRLPQAGVLANKKLKKFLVPEGYYEVAHTTGLWRHTTQPIQFSLLVDNYCVKYVGKKHADHLNCALQKHYASVSEDWEGKLYCGITLEWNYAKPWVDISMPGYIKKLRQRCHHKTPKKPQHIPYRTQPKVYSTAEQDAIPWDDSDRLNDDKKK